VRDELNKSPRKQEAKMRNMAMVEIKAFVPARDFARKRYDKKEGL